MPTIKFLKRYTIWVPGDVTTMNFPVAEQLVKRGVAEWLVDLECAAVEAPENAMKKRPRKRKKGRAKK